MESSRNVENRQEFAKASELSLVFRQALAKYTNRFNSKDLNAKLTKNFYSLIKKDKINVRGERTIQPDNLELLKNLSLTKSASPQLFIFQNFSVEIEGTTSIKAVLRFSGEVIPTVHFKKIKAATHISLSVVLLQTDFTQNNGSKISETVKYFALNDSSDQSQNIETSEINAEPGYNAFALLFISYFQEVNDVKYLLENKNINSSVISDTKPS